MPQVSLLMGENNLDDPKGSAINETVVPLPISITYGYSRDHRPDLKQLILDLICSGDGDVPFFLRVADGNEVDKAVFAQILCDFKKQLNLDTLMVADSALYTAPNLAQMENLKWLSRVPLTVKQAKLLVSQLTEKDLVPSQIKGYRWSQHQSNYGGIEQRWLVVESVARRQSDLRKFEKNLEKSEKGASQKLRDLCKQKFTCQQDAQEAAERLSGKLKYHNLVNIQTREQLTGSPNKASEQTEEFGKITYQVQAHLGSDMEVVVR